MPSPAMQAIPYRPPGPHPALNRLLAAMIEAGGRDLLPALQSVSLRAGDALYEPNSAGRFAYFPTSAIVCVLQELEDGTQVEFIMTGNEGMLGIPLVLGAGSMPFRAVVLCAGHVYRVGIAALQKELARGGVLQHVLLRYTQAAIAQISQTAACYRHHNLEQQLCRWLLMCLDRLPPGELTMTQERIAIMLGVRREGINQAAGHLQARGIIQGRRGHITVLDRAGLEASVCECYSAVRNEYDRLFSASPQPEANRWRPVFRVIPKAPRAPGTRAPSTPTPASPQSYGAARLPQPAPRV